MQWPDNFLGLGDFFRFVLVPAIEEAEHKAENHPGQVPQSPLVEEQDQNLLRSCL